jgi:hypothetical protein
MAFYTKRFDITGLAHDIVKVFPQFLIAPVTAGIYPSVTVEVEVPAASETGKEGCLVFLGEGVEDREGRKNAYPVPEFGNDIKQGPENKPQFLRRKTYYIGA